MSIRAKIECHCDADLETTDTSSSVVAQSFVVPIYVWTLCLAVLLAGDDDRSID